MVQDVLIQDYGSTFRVYKFQSLLRKWLQHLQELCLLESFQELCVSESFEEIVQLEKYYGTIRRKLLLQSNNNIFKPSLPSNYEVAKKGAYINPPILKILYNTRALDSALLMTLSTLASMQSKPTKHMVRLVTWLLDYVATKSEAILMVKKSDMILVVFSAASYLSEAMSSVQGRWKIHPTMERYSMQPTLLRR